MRCAGARIALGALAQFEFLLVAAALAEGWAVSVPDHEGTDGIWGTPHEPGYRVLDGLRAALGYERLGLSPTAPIGLWGYSGGGLATAWAAEVCGDYAPELNIVGAVLGSPVGDLGHTFRRLNGTLLLGPARDGGGRAVPRLPRPGPGDPASTPPTRARRCWPALENDDHRARRAADGRHGHGRPASTARWRKSSTAPRCSTSSTTSSWAPRCPTPPVLIVQAVHDQIVSVDDIDELADSYSAGRRHR